MLRRYYPVEDPKTGVLSTGSSFDGLAGGGETPDVRDRITDSDFVAVSCSPLASPPKPQSASLTQPSPSA
ncbi:DUF6308 family protein [Arthrobacter sp. TE12231]